MTAQSQSQKLIADLGINITADIARALDEDIQNGDLSANLIDERTQTTARIICRDEAIICGRPWAEAAFHELAPNAKISWLVNEGAKCKKNDVIFEVYGKAKALLSAERTALNYLQLLSAIATKTAQFVDMVAGTKAKIVDTRKTLPGLRLAQKYAVSIGGGINHRIGLFDAILLKENHIAATGSVTKALQQAFSMAQTAKFVMIEVETLNQLAEALEAGAKFILLDNMNYATISEAVTINNNRAILEVSGGINLSTIRAFAETGVDRISIGGLTKDVTATDFSMRFIQEAK
jgi:nicotinate-nucleotide pyrophosphorylase (carboxylating)